jgi:pyrroloquinoline quinone biosynthesis protein D
MSDAPDPAGRRQRLIISAASKPRLPRHIKLRHDEARDRWTILAPERVFSPDPIAVEILKLCDGNRTVENLADVLALRYDAPKERILADIVSMLQELADKGVVSCNGALLH